MNNYFIIAIDGPAGVGKSSVSMNVATKLGFTLIDTGAMYRSVSLTAKENGIEINDLKVIDIAKNINVNFKTSTEGNKVFIDSKDVSTLIRTEEISKSASAVAKIKEVREHLVNKQREFSKTQSVVMEGRDIGSVVFPDATVKIFLTADPKERALRRFKELQAKNPNINFEETLKDLMSRDDNDTNRKESPLIKTADAIEIDTTHLTIDEVVEQIISIAKLRIK